MTPAEQPVFALEVAGVPVLTFQAVSTVRQQVCREEQWL